MIIAVIPARGGSKRIPKKNIKLFLGKPIICYSIEAALKSNLFDDVIVSTDDADIAQIAKSAGASVPFVRPDDLSDDHTGTNPVVAYTINWLEGQNQRLDFTCCIYPTAPFLSEARLIEGYRIISSKKFDFAFSVRTFEFPVQRALRLVAGGVEPIWADDIPSRSQDLEAAFHDAGQFYWGIPAAFVEGRPLFSRRSAPVHIPRHMVQDIDTYEDWEQAELMYKSCFRIGGER